MKKKSLIYSTITLLYWVCFCVKVILSNCLFSLPNCFCDGQTLAYWELFDPCNCVATVSVGTHYHGPSIVYTQQQVLALLLAIIWANTGLLTGESNEIHQELRRRRCRAGVKCWEKQTFLKPSLPSISMDNVESLPSKMDTLLVLIKNQKMHWDVAFPTHL